MALTLFGEWVRIYKAFRDDLLMTCVMEISEDFLGKALSKVININNEFVLLLF